MTQDANCKTIGPEHNRAIKFKIIARLCQSKLFLEQRYILKYATSNGAINKSFKEHHP